MSWIRLQAEDGHHLRAWQVAPTRVPPRGGLVVLQEIFGVNAHIRDLCERYAQAGWLAIAPSLFDRSGGSPDGLGYSAEDIARGRALKDGVREPEALLDVAAAIDEASKSCQAVGVVGFCWGGTLSWLAACKLSGLAAAVAYYGTSIALHADEQPRVPTLLHFGEQDTHIPPEDVDRITAAHPELPVFRYAAGHGFHCDARPSYDAASAELAARRTTAFLEAQLDATS